METTILTLRPQNILTIAIIIVGLSLLVFAGGQVWSYTTGGSNG